ncbi:MAG: 4-(cytidine 5'-diphospho)-2-C-methyl-D-erythritol kinase [Flavobacteriales bacterium]
MLAFPFAKINLGLNVVRKRADGFHVIESVLVPIPLHDAVEIVTDPTLRPNEAIFTRSGIPVPGDPQDDLCLKAVRAVQAARTLPGLRLHLHKVIPTGAGLGGGSSDAAHVLLLLNDLLDLQLGRAELHAMAATLGSDCPFFLEERPQLAEGRGEQLSPITLDLRGQWLVLVNPGIHVGTAEVYRNTVPTERSIDLPAALARNSDTWRTSVVNTMEPYVFRTHPAIAALHATLHGMGAYYAAMSGSGSSVFGLFRERPVLPSFPVGHHVWCLQL